jgi:tRNA pseudouridine synthase 9
LIEHFTTRRELPVYNQEIKKIYEDEEIMAFDKPPSMPVHPCGAYNKNSMVSILNLEKGLTDIHRRADC